MATRTVSKSTNDNHLSSKHLTNVRSNVTTVTNETYEAAQTVINYVRNVTDSLLDVLSNLSLSEMCDFNARNFQFMQRLMYLNANEIKLTLNALGSDAVYHGDSTQITTSILQAPSYIDDRNYVENYARGVPANENRGINTTRRPISSATYTDYANINQLYKETINLFPDDIEKAGTFYNKWNVSEALDSTLRKTKELFRQNKINTIISAFHTSTTTPEAIGDIRSRFGLSRGRNLLTKEAEESGKSYPINGYDNPYCRVWTHHYQYDRLDKLIRPFYVADETNRSTSHVIKLKDFHQWDKFKVTTPLEGETTPWGWKSSQNDGWKYSVLGDNGFVNITPKYNNGGNMNTHTKQCMFSIENLAWQGFDPYSFEKALSWEQRGPMGGRIMWFPPYNLTFNESSSANWDRHTFIGRGEPIYTYTNTERRGTLNFSLVIDHPSILDYVTWDDSNDDKVSDTDLLRFFAGCESDSASTNGRGSNNGGSLRDYATPTPLTDEYTTYEAPTVAEPQNTEPDNVPPETLKYTFFVFFPNNYAGYYDKPGDSKNTGVEYNTGVEAMAYLLAGQGAQKEKDDDNPAHPKDMAITFENMSADGWGYEMGEDEGISRKQEDNYIQGTSAFWKNLTNKTYTDATNGQKRWYYRIDGQYRYESDSLLRNTNCYDQKVNESSCSDTQSYGFNCDADTIAADSDLVEKAEGGAIVSFAEVAYALSQKTDVQTIIKNNSGDVFKSENAEALVELFYGNTGSYTIESFEIIGFANSQGVNLDQITNDNRNIILAKHRAHAVADWIENGYLNSIDKEKSEKISVSISNDNADDSDALANFVVPISITDPNDKKAKKWRSAMVNINYKKVEVTTIEETEQTSTTDTSYETTMQEVGERNGTTIYKNANETDPEKKDLLWYFEYPTGEYKLYEESDVIDRSAYESFRSNKSTNGVTALDGSDERNRRRYDQEYFFFRKLEKDNPIVFASLKKKLKYFNPAFHSISGEGFSLRLNFLQECLRQGSTIGASDPNARTANNLAFGRPPVCVLRIGDFFNTKIIPENLSISYDNNGGIQWDLNPEGAGVQPMIAHISLSFYFIGGSDIRGAVARLQNALSMNYYANSSLYDNRADRVSYNYDAMTSGAIDHELNVNDSYFHDVPLQN